MEYSQLLIIMNIDRTWSLIAAMDKNHVIFGSHGDNLCFADVITQNILLDTTGMYIFSWYE